MHTHIHTYKHKQIHSLTKSFIYYNMNEPRDTVLKILDTQKHCLISLMCGMLKKVKLKYGD